MTIKHALDRINIVFCLGDDPKHKSIPRGCRFGAASHVRMTLVLGYYGIGRCWLIPKPYPETIWYSAKTRSCAILTQLRCLEVKIIGGPMYRVTLFSDEPILAEGLASVLS